MKTPSTPPSGDADPNPSNDNSSPTPTPLEHRIDDQGAPGRDTTAEPKDKPNLALERLFERAEESEKKHRSLKAELDASAKELKAFGVTPGEPVSMDRLPLNRNLIVKAADVLKDGKLKVKDFQRGMNFFDTGELARVRKALMAAGVTIETAEGSVVFVSLSVEFASDATAET